jgi:mannose-6-phosphate isomerase
MLDPLVFTPSLRPRIWGGRRLASVLGKVLPDEQPYGESWELSPVEPYITRVAEGPLAGRGLDEVWTSHRPALVGERVDLLARKQFPLLIKWLDCTERLSVQVHPDDATAPALGHPVGKAEAWLVVDAAPAATICSGLRKGVTRHGFERRLAAETVEEALHTFSPRIGEAIAVPPGTVHFLGGGLLILEVCQPSDATFRLHDWGRPGPDGRPRPLHLRESLQSIDWTQGPVGPANPVPIGGLPDGVQGTRLVAMPQFEILRYEVAGNARFTPPTNGELSVWVVLSGSATLRTVSGTWQRAFERGETVLVPATAAVEWVPGQSPVALVAVTLPESR